MNGKIISQEENIYIFAIEKKNRMKRVLITGANGFIGSMMTDYALAKEYEVWVGVRANSNMQFLEGKDVNRMNMDYSSEDALEESFLTVKEKHGGFDYIIHCAGATQCLNEKDFERINFSQTKMIVDILIKNDMLPKKFIFISSLSVMGAIHEDTYEPIKSNETARPNTAYGSSKLAAEKYIESKDIDYIIYRPTGVYGPREKDYFMMADSIKKHIDISVGYKPQKLTFVYVEDLVKAVFLGIEKNVSRRTYIVTDGGEYSSTDFSDLIIKELGNPKVVRLRLPLCILWFVCFISGLIAKLRGKTTTLNLDKYRIMKQRNWLCDISPIEEELGYKAEYNLERGTKKTIKWYKENKWL